jgi:hypothetical protein
MPYTNIDDPSAYFQAVLWTGDGLDNKQITNDGNSDLQPDWVWLKDRTQAESPAIFDSTRGATVRLQPNNTNAESTETATLKSFTTDGFTVGTSGSVNNGSNPDQYVAWQWKANGGTTSSNTDGSITSTVQANTDAGFSIGTFTGTGAAATIGHGLGVKPDMLILKSRNNPSGAAMYWMVAHVGLDGMAGTKNLFMNENWAADTSSAVWGNVAPTSSVFTVSTNAAVNYSGNNMLFYAFANKQGYSKFGKYVGNGNANGTFVYTGFKPEFVIVKRSDSANNWIITDNARGINGANPRLYADLADAEGSAADYIDHLSNGFKIRTSAGSMNTNGGSYIYMAFAENPFTTSTGIPTTAR